MDSSGRRAVVLGASVGGLLAARALRDHFAQVTVIERDAPPPRGESRKGVPQDRHAHVMLVRGSDGLQRFFPGFLADLQRLGAQVGDMLRDGEFVLEGYRMPRHESGLTSLQCARPLLEGYLRERLLAEGRVTLRARCEAVGLSGDSARVRGVRVRDLEHERADELVEAELVVDATGRGTRFPRWLTELGHRAPDEERVEIGLGYVTAIYRRSPGTFEDRLGTMITVVPPERRRGGAAFVIDQDRFIVTLAGCLGDHPPPDHAAMQEFARELAAPDIAELLAVAEPLSEPVAYKYPYSRRLHYERVRGYPAGAIAFGDSLCSFNPAYGQGMTVAVQEAELLHELLARARAATTLDLPRAFYRQAARIIDVPWSLSTGADLRFDEVPGKRPWSQRFMNAYYLRVVSAASADVGMTVQLMRVMQLMDPPTALLRPNMVMGALLRGGNPPARLRLPRELTVSGVR